LNNKDNAHHKDKMNCLQWAVFKKHSNCLNILLISGLFADEAHDLKNIMDEMDNNLIHLAASVNNLAIIELLMSMGVPADAKNKRGHLPVDVCTDNTCKEVLRYYSHSDNMRD
jgi:ankyrin repeat protein